MQGQAAPKGEYIGKQNPARVKILRTNALAGFFCFPIVGLVGARPDLLEVGAWVVRSGGVKVWRVGRFWPEKSATAPLDPLISAGSGVYR